MTYILPAKMLCFCDKLSPVICYYPGVPHVVKAIWPYLLVPTKEKVMAKILIQESDEVCGVCIVIAFITWDA